MHLVGASVSYGQISSLISQFEVGLYSYETHVKLLKLFI